MRPLTHVGQYWSASASEVRLLGASDVSLAPSGRIRGQATDLSSALPLPGWRRRFREALAASDWRRVSWTYSTLPFPTVELVEVAEERGCRVSELLAQATTAAKPLDLSSLDRPPSPLEDHLVAPVIPRRAQAFGVTYLNSALERETEGRRGDYGYVYRAVKERGERPELFLKGTSPEHFVGPGGFMGLRSDLTNSELLDGTPCERLPVSAGIEPELAAVVHSTGEIWGYTLANDVSGNRIENETILYLTQAKHFTGALVLGPLIWLSDEQRNPGVEIAVRIRAASGALLFERSTNSSRINAPIATLIEWVRSHVRLHPAEVFSTGTDMVPEGEVKVLSEGMTVEIHAEPIGCLRHRARPVPQDGELNLDYSRLEFQSRDAARA